MNSSPMMPSTDNRRHHTRLPYQYRVQTRKQVFPIVRDSLIDASGKDISKGGLCVESPVPLSVGTRLQVRVYAPLPCAVGEKDAALRKDDAEQYFDAEVVVAWVKAKDEDHIVGLRFVDVDEELRVALDCLVEEASRDMEGKGEDRSM